MTNLVNKDKHKHKDTEVWKQLGGNVFLVEGSPPKKKQQHTKHKTPPIYLLILVQRQTIWCQLQIYLSNLICWSPIWRQFWILGHKK